MLVGILLQRAVHDWEGAAPHGLCRKIVKERG